MGEKRFSIEDVFSHLQKVAAQVQENGTCMESLKVGQDDLKLECERLRKDQDHLRDMLREELLREYDQAERTHEDTDQGMVENAEEANEEIDKNIGGEGDGTSADGLSHKAEEIDDENEETAADPKRYSESGPYSKTRFKNLVKLKTSVARIESASSQGSPRSKARVKAAAAKVKGKGILNAAVRLSTIHTARVRFKANAAKENEEANSTAEPKAKAKANAAKEDGGANSTGEPKAKAPARCDAKGNASEDRVESGAAGLADETASIKEKRHSSNRDGMPSIQEEGKGRSSSREERASIKEGSGRRSSFDEMPSIKEEKRRTSSRDGISPIKDEKGRSLSSDRRVSLNEENGRSLSREGRTSLKDETWSNSSCDEMPSIREEGRRTSRDEAAPRKEEKGRKSSRDETASIKEDKGRRSSHQEMAPIAEEKGRKSSRDEKASINEKKERRTSRDQSSFINLNMGRKLSQASLVSSVSSKDADVW